MGKLGGDRSSLGPGRIPPTPGNKRNSGLDADQMSNMFPDAVAAIAKEKADFQEQTGTAPTSNRNSAVGDRPAHVAPTISAPRDDSKRDAFGQVQPSPWRQRSTDATVRPKSSSGQQPMGQFSQPLQSAGLRSPRPFPLNNDNASQNHNFNSADNHAQGMGMLSPFLPGQSWGSVMNTPMVPNFNLQNNMNQADMIAAATQAKLGAMSTINSRFQLDDVRQYRRARSTDGDKHGMHHAMPPTIGAPGLMTNQLGQALTPEQAASMQQQQLDAMRGRRSPTGSPARGGPMGPGLGGGMNVPPQNNGFLSVFDANTALLNNGMAGMSLGQYGVGSDTGYLSDASDIHRGRSPRGKRGSSKPPDDPTNVELLKDIPNWLRSLRLHKYTDNLKDMNWKDLIMLDEEGLEAKGVGAQGARKKMIKVGPVSFFG